MPALTTQGFFYEMKIFAKELTSGKCSLLTTYSAKLIRDVLEYSIPAKMPGLSTGLYRLTVVIILSTPVKIGGFYDKTTVDVI